MKVKELKERLQAFDQELDVYLYNDKEPALYLADTINQTSDWGDEDGWEDFITIFPSTDTKPLFTLTAEEVEEIRQTIAYALDKRIDWIIANEHKLDDYERSVLERLNEKDQKNLKKILEYLETRKQWQDENNG